MTMSETRIFIGNLPPNVGEKDLQGRLKKLGKLSDVTIKQRTDHEGRITSTFAHCSITADDVNKCLDKLMDESWNGHSVKAEIAKKSAQQRLQEHKPEARENETNNHWSAPPPVRQNNVNVTRGGPNKLTFPVMTKAQIKKFEDSSDSESEVFWKPPVADNVVEMGGAEEPKPKRRRRMEEMPTKFYDSKPTAAQSDLLKRLENFSSVWGDDEHHSSHYNDSPAERARNNASFYGNGNGYSSERPAVMEKEEEAPKLNERKKEKKKDKTEKAVVPSDGKKLVTKTDKKIRSEEKRMQSLNERADQFKQQQDLVKKALAGKGANNKKITFDDDDQVEAGKKSVNLFDEGSDDDQGAGNFKIKKQFEGKKGEKLLELQSRFGMDARFKLDGRFADREDEGKSDSENEDSELAKQMSILEKVVGKKAKDNMKPIVRYDPSKPDHGEKYRLQKKIDEDSEEEEKNETPMPEVSSERYFEVKSDLQFKDDQNQGFSLRNLFGGQEEINDHENEPAVKKDKEKSSKTKKIIKNPLIREDSSDESADEEVKEQAPPKQISFSDTFFFSANDSRFDEGKEFFKNVKSLAKEEFGGKRRSLWSTMKSKRKTVTRKRAAFTKKLGGRPTKDKFTRGRGKNFRNKANLS